MAGDMASLDARVTPSPDVLFQMLDGETVLLDLRSGKYFGMDAVGTRMWALLMETGRPRTVIAHLLREYAVDENRLRAELLEWIDRLAAQGLLTVETLPLDDDL